MALVRKDSHSELAFIFTEMSNWKTYPNKSMMSIKMSGSVTPLGRSVRDPLKSASENRTLTRLFQFRFQAKIDFVLETRTNRFGSVER